MRSLIIGLLLVSGWVNALTLSPMRQDEISYKSNVYAYFQLENTSNNVMFFDIWISTNPDTLEPAMDLYKGEEVLGGNSYKQISVPIKDIKPNKLEVFYVCVQEKPSGSEIVIAGRVCAKLRYYWPQAELQLLR